MSKDKIYRRLCSSEGSIYQICGQQTITTNQNSSTICVICLDGLKNLVGVYWHNKSSFWVHSRLPFSLFPWPGVDVLKLLVSFVAGELKRVTSIVLRV